MKTYLVLDQQLDTLNRSSGGLRDGSGDTTHCYRTSVNVLMESLSMMVESWHRVDDDKGSSGLESADVLKKSITKGGL